MTQLTTVPVTLNIDNAFGWIAPSAGQNIGLKDIVKQIQGLTVSKVEGAAASTAVSLEKAGGSTKANRILTTDVILAAVAFISAAGSGFDRLSLRNDIRCVSTGNVHFSGASTAGQQIIVFWYSAAGFSTQT